MTAKQSHNTQKALLGVSISVIIILLGAMTSLMFKFSDHLINFEKENNDAHQQLIESVNGHSFWTHSVYEYEIKPNTEFRLKSQKNK